MDFPATSKLTLEDLYKAVCWKHAKVQQPWNADEVAFWHAVAAGLAWALKIKGLTDRQLREMENDAITLGPSGRWDDIIETLNRPDGTLPHED